MSNGWCTDHCRAQGKFAFAVISFQDCWCSDYIPTDQRGTGDCSTVCPGFGTEICGNKDESLYVYVKLDGPASGTVGGSKPTSSANVSPSSAAAASSTTAEAPPSSEATSVSSALSFVRTIPCTPCFPSCLYLFLRPLRSTLHTFRFSAFLHRSVFDLM
jgi:cell wall integrity and stress response component